MDKSNFNRLEGEMLALPLDNRERRLYKNLDGFSHQFLSCIPTSGRSEAHILGERLDTLMPPAEFQEAAARYLLMPSPALAPYVGNLLTLSWTENEPGPRQLDHWGDVLCTAKLPGLATFTGPHTDIQHAIVKLLHQLDIRHWLEVKGLFQELISASPRDAALGFARREVKVPDFAAFLPTLLDSDE